MSKTPETTSPRERLRKLPSVEKLVSSPRFTRLGEIFGRSLLVTATRAALDELREGIVRGLAPGDVEAALAALDADVRSRLEKDLRPSLRPVINATGVIIHTNLGRAPLSARALDAVREAAKGYTNLELDVPSGKRGSRHRHAARLLARLFPSKEALVVNNAAAAVMLSLNTFASGKEVVISRGELVEIGGSFRVPEILARSGARLREVGTTNKTRLTDYEAAIGPDTGALLRVHPSNFRVVGFTESTATEDLVRLGNEHGLVVIEDFGSGNLLPLRDYALGAEPRVAESLETGVHVCIFSGDKLLGGPQAGILLGDAARIEALKRNPMTRALRVDKLVYAALEATLFSFVEEKAFDEIPVLRMIALSPEDIHRRAAGLLERLRDETALELSILDASSRVGGGAAADAELPTKVLTVSKAETSAEALAKMLREHEPPVLARIAEDRVLLDLRTVAPIEEPTLERAIRGLAASE